MEQSLWTPRVAFLGTLVALGACAPRPPPPAAAAATAAAPERCDVRAILERALPSVALVLDYRNDGGITYGAGLVVDDAGRVLTAQHVLADAARLAVMLHREGRTSYTPMDGGLKRYLFENQRDIVEAHVESGDPTADLAVIRIDADTTRVPHLDFAGAPVKPGDEVLALGHPQETVWSFTTGVVSALHHGAIQHDAVINDGSSGGPLLDGHGQVIGINVAKAKGVARGFGFARPIEMARVLLAPATAAVDLDLSTPASSAISCWHAEEMALPSVAECFDWESEWRVLARGVDELRARRRLPPEVDRALRDYFASADNERAWIATSKRRLTNRLRSGLLCSCGDPEADPMLDGPGGPVAAVRGLTEELGRLRGDLRAAMLLQDRMRHERNGLKGGFEDLAALRALMRMGLRIEEVRQVDAALAWVRLVGRNTDGTAYVFSECYAKVGDRWLQRVPPLPSDTAALPPGWPPPFDSFDYHRAKLLASFIKQFGPGKS